MTARQKARLKRRIGQEIKETIIGFSLGALSGVLFIIILLMYCARVGSIW